MIRNLLFLFLIIIGLNSGYSQISNTSDSNIGKHNKSDFIYNSASVLSTGDWYRIATDKSGIYKILYTDLVDYGMTLPVSSQNIKIYGNGGKILSETGEGNRIDDLREISIFVNDGGDGMLNNTNDYILFYSEGPVSWNPTDNKYFTHTVNIYSDFSYYFLTVSNESGKRIKTAEPVLQSPDISVNDFNDYAFHEKDTVNLIKSGKLWLGEVFRNNLCYNFSFNFPDICFDKKTFITTSVAARSFTESKFLFITPQSEDSLTVPMVDQSATSDYAKICIDTFSIYPNNPDISLSVKYEKTDISSIGWLNYIEINAIRTLKYNNNQLQFRNLSSVNKGIAEYNIKNAGNNLVLMSVSEPSTPQIIPFNINNDTIKFKFPTDSLNEFLIFGPNDSYKPVFIEKLKNQNLHALGNYDLIIITHPDFYEQAQRLAQLHSEIDGLSVFITQPQVIYNEFSSGKQDISAIRDFVKMFYDRAQGDSSKYVKYLLLFGDGSYDMKNRLANNTNFIPTYQTNNSMVSTASYVSDDFYGIVDDSQLGSLIGKIYTGIGRLPCKTPAEAKNLVDKIIRYRTKKNEIGYPEDNYHKRIKGWKNDICFIADDEDNNLHLNQAEGLCTLLDSTNQNFNIDKIYLDAFIQQNTTFGPRYPDVNKIINERVEKGLLMLNYTGHGGEFGLTGEEVLMNGDIYSWENDYCLPLFVTATCEFSRYDNPEASSAGENILLRSNGGGIALMTTTRISFAHSNEVLNRNLITVGFDFNRNNPPRLGDIIKKTKNNAPSGVYKQNFTLLGDPALTLHYPEYNIATLSVNNKTVTGKTDTLSNLQTITVEGNIEDFNGTVKSDFNGTVYIKVYDNPVKYTTNANDQQSYRQDFTIQNKVIFVGKASVINGFFNFSFVVPKDITYNNGFGRISYYAESTNNEDADGYYNKITFLNNDTISSDTAGPEIKLYMNDHSFVEGGVTGSNPLFIADLNSKYGINFFDNGIGHQITAILDGKVNEPLVMDDYFSPDINTYKSGNIEYKFSLLSVGTHSILLKAWDIIGNSSEKSISFTVGESNNLELSEVINYPNPFSDKTRFSFVHNIPVQELRVLIRIYNYEGVLLKNIESKVYGDSGIKHFIEWDGTDAAGNHLKNGIYFYKFRLYSEKDKYLEKTNKLIIIN